MRKNFYNGWFGKYELIISDRQGKVIERTGLKPNLIMDVGLNMFRDQLSGAITDAEIKYVALGATATTPVVTQTTLASEQFRKLITSQTNMAGSGALETLGYIAEAEGNGFKTEEIGWFAGVGATATVNTGIMVARILYSRQKTALEVWSIVRTDTINRI